MTSVFRRGVNEIWYGLVVSYRRTLYKGQSLTFEDWISYSETSLTTSLRCVTFQRREYLVN